MICHYLTLQQGICHNVAKFELAHLCEFLFRAVLFSRCVLALVTTDGTMQLPSIHHGSIETIGYQWPIPLFATKGNSVVVYGIVEKVNASHSFVVLMNYVWLIYHNHLTFLSFITSHAMRWFDLQIIGQHSNGLQCYIYVSITKLQNVYVNTYSIIIPTNCSYFIVVVVYSI